MASANVPCYLHECLNGCGVLLIVRFIICLQPIGFPCSLSALWNGKTCQDKETYQTNTLRQRTYGCICVTLNWVLQNSNKTLSEKPFIIIKLYLNCFCPLRCTKKKKKLSYGHWPYGNKIVNTQFLAGYHFEQVGF